MIPTLPTRRSNGFRPAASWVGAAALTLGFLFGSPASFAAAPPANTVIGNQASATYSDAAGTTQLATSNLVQTTVQQVGSFTLDNIGNATLPLTVVNTKIGSVGSTVYTPHTLTNTGNGSDTFSIKVDADTDKFSKVEVYADANGDGVPDSTTFLCSVTSAGVCDVPAQTVAGNNGVFRFVVAYTIPGTASGASTVPATFDTATLTATPGTPALYTAPNTSAAVKDDIKLTTAAAFNVTKTIGAPSVSPSLGGKWPTASTDGPRSAASGCALDWSATLASNATCQYTVYTLTFNNTGGAAGRFAMSDALPSGLTYVKGSAVWSSAPGVQLNDGPAGDPSGIDFQVIGGNTLNTVVTSLGQNVTQTLSFVVLVNSSAAIGTSTTTNVAKFEPASVPADVTAANLVTPGSSTNPSAYKVLASYGIAVGTNPSTAASAADTTPGTPNSNSADLTTRPSIVAGGSVKFAQSVFNTGTGTDTVNLTVAPGTFPAGTTFLFFAVDGVTPLLDTSGDGVPDTGPIPAGGSVNFVLQASVPSTTVVGTGPFSTTVTGRSVGDSTKIDATFDTVTAVIGSLVDLTNTASGTGVGSVGNGDLGPGPSPLPTTTVEVAPGASAQFALYVRNNDSLPNTYDLAASQSTSFPGSLPAGWTVKFVAMPGGTCASSAITSALVAVGAQVPLLACVTPPATQLPVTALKIYFQVQSRVAASTGAIVSDVKTDAVTVTAAVTYSAALSPNNSGQVAPGGSVVYPHTLTNTGSQSCGAYTLTATVPPTDATLGWTTAIYLDVNENGQIDSTDTLVTGSIASLPVGAKQKLLVRVFAPGGAIAGVTDTTTVTATFAAGETSCGTPTATDISTVITGQIRVLKTQAPDVSCTGVVADPALFVPTVLTLKPGQCIVYKVVATNEGTASIANIAINDAVPPYTTLSARQPTAQCVGTSATGVSGTTLPAYASSATAVSCGSTANSVAPSGTVTLTFAVKINQ